MKELVQVLMEKTGMQEEKAMLVVEVVLQYFDERLPEPIASQLGTGGDDVDRSDSHRRGGWNG